MTSPAPRIAVVGSLHYDILVTGGDRPRKGETVFASAWEWKCGGKGGNQAIEAARHGAEVAFVGAVGKDSFGDAMIARLRASNVETSGIRRNGDVGSGMSVAIFDPAGDYGAVIVPGSNWTIGESDLEAEPALKSCTVLLLQNEVQSATNLAAARIARSQGATVILNAAPARDLPADMEATIDILVVNEVEAEMMTGADPITEFAAAEVAAAQLLRRAPSVIVTLGARGLVVATRTTGPQRIPGHPVIAVSTHGAGDALIGAMAAQVALGSDLSSAARYANAAAAALVATPESERALLTSDAAHTLLSETAF